MDSEMRKILTHMRLDFITKSVDQHVAAIRQMAARPKMSKGKALKLWREMADACRLSEDKRKAVERHF